MKGAGEGGKSAKKCSEGYENDFFPYEDWIKNILGGYIWTQNIPREVYLNLKYTERGIFGLKV